MDEGHKRAIGEFAAGRPLAVILNSRQSKRPCRRDAWVEGTRRAVERLVADESVLVTSTGMNTWELVAYLTNAIGGCQVMLAESNADGDKIRTSFRLDPKRSLILSDWQCSDTKPAASPHYRDDTAILIADRVVPVSIRPGGYFQKGIASFEVGGKAVDYRFLSKYDQSSDRPRYDFSAASLNPLLVSQEWTFLTHWTRSHHGPCPGESAAEFYSDVLASDKYPRSALCTLERIIRDGRIRASRRFIRGGYDTVSLTALSPAAAVNLMRWRRRYVYYNFEPYGIALGLEAARMLGIRPVIYADEEDFDRLPDSDRPFFQKSGSPVADWTPEAEWRHLGDLDSGGLEREQVKVIVYRPEEIAVINGICDFEAVSLTV